VITREDEETAKRVSTSLSSWPDLIRPSIPLHSQILRGDGMDCRVKPGNDDKYYLLARHATTLTPNLKSKDAR
jgi:hypothetical protein